MVGTNLHQIGSIPTLRPRLALVLPFKVIEEAEVLRAVTHQMNTLVLCCLLAQVANLEEDIALHGELTVSPRTRFTLLVQQPGKRSRLQVSNPHHLPQIKGIHHLSQPHCNFPR